MSLKNLVVLLYAKDAVITTDFTISVEVQHYN